MANSRRILLFVCMTLSMAWPASLYGQADSGQEAEATWGNNEAEGEANWGGGEAQVTTWSTREGVHFGPPGCPVAVIGDTAWNLTTFQPICRLEGWTHTRGMSAISPGGKFFAQASKSANQRETDLMVWSLETGKQHVEIAGSATQYFDLIQFASDKFLLTGGRDRTVVERWDMERLGGRAEINLPKAIRPGEVALSPNGRYLAAKDSNHLVVIDTNNGRRVVSLSPAGAVAGSRPVQTSTSTASSILAWMRPIAFSPDARELVGLTSQPTDTLIGWNTQGNVILNLRLTSAGIGSDRELDWVPDGTAWLIGKHLVDRQTGSVLGRLEIEGPRLFLDRDRLLCEITRSGNLRVITIPWDRINLSLAAMKHPDAAYLSPARPISVAVQIVDPRGDVADATRRLTEAATKALESRGIKVASNQPTTLVIKLTERLGSAVPIFERAGHMDYRSSGRTVNEAQGILDIRLHSALSPSETIWKHRSSTASGRIFDGDISDATVRSSLIHSACYVVSRMNLPTFIPKNQEMMHLPFYIK